MDISEGKEKFITAWGDLGVNWGITKTMGQIHGLLLVSARVLCADDIKEELGLSSGIVNKSIKTLLEWGLIEKQDISTSRKDFYMAEKDFWNVFKKIIEHRKKKELDPLVSLLEEVACVDGVCTESKEFCKVLKELKLFSSKTDAALNNVMNSKANWLINSYLKMVR